MKYNVTNIIGDAGEHLVAARIIKFFGYPCRLTNIDIGIDAEIELIDSNYKSTGQFIKCQIKTTTSDKFHLYLDDRHIVYWNKLNVPVVIFLVHLQEENIYWHCVDNIQTYDKSDSGYKISFNANDILSKANKERFDEIALFQFKQQIRNIYEKAYTTVVYDNEQFLETNNYDVVTFEDFVLHSNRIKFDFKKVDNLFRKYASLNNLKTEYAQKLSTISTYLDRIEEEKEVILMDHGQGYFDHLGADRQLWN